MTVRPVGAERLRMMLEPWVVTPEAYRALCSSAMMARPADEVDGTNCVEVRADFPEVAIVHVKGSLSRYASWWGGTSYGELAKDLQRVLDNDGFKAVLWNFDSPGGEVNGCAELGEMIYAARAKKPMAVYVSGVCASGALWLGSAAAGGAMECAPTAIIGSIGVITWLYDDSKMLDEIGIKEFEIVASQSPRKSQDAADAGYRARVQQRLDDLCDVFQAAVARNYGVPLSTVQRKFGQGDTFVGARAVDAGLAAKVSDFESVLAATAARVRAATSNPFIGAEMDNKVMARLLKLEDGASERQIEDRAQALAQFERSVLAATESKTPEEAIGKVTAGGQAIAERDKLQVQVKAQEAEMCSRELRAEAKAALKDGRLTLGELKVLTSFMKDDERAKAEAALAGVKSQEKKEMLDALCAGGILRKRLESVKAFLAAKTPQLPAPKKEPANDEKNRGDVTAANADAVAAYSGLAKERTIELAKVESVEQLERTIDKKKGA